MAGKNGFRTEQFIKAIPGTHGNITEIAKRVGCSWNTAKKYITEYITVKEVYEEECNAVDDKARSNITEKIFRGDIHLSKWWLQVKSPDFTPKSHVTHDGEIEHVVTVNWDDDGIPD